MRPTSDTSPKEKTMPDDLLYVGMSATAIRKSVGQVLVPCSPHHTFGSDSWPLITNSRLSHLLDDRGPYQCVVSFGADAAPLGAPPTEGLTQSALHRPRAERLRGGRARCRGPAVRRRAAGGLEGTAGRSGIAGFARRALWPETALCGPAADDPAKLKLAPTPEAGPKRPSGLAQARPR